MGAPGILRSVGTAGHLSAVLCLSKMSNFLSGWELYSLHNFSPMLISLTTLLATLSSIFRARAALELENLALRHQIGVLQRSAAKRPKLTSGDRLLWVCLSRLWRDWGSALAIVKPETVIAWHRGRLSAVSGPGRCGEAHPDDLSFRARSEI